MSRESSTAHITSKSTLNPTIKAWRIFLDDQGNSVHTVKAFTADMHLLAAYLPPDRSLGDISTADLNTFLDWMQKGRGVSCSAKTLARRITSIKAFFRWLHKNGVIIVDPAERVVQRSVISPLPEILSADEILAVIEAADGHRRGSKPDARSYTLVKLLLDTGIKKGESLAIGLNHIDLENPQGATLFIRYTSPGYRYKERKIPLSPEWVAAYHEYAVQYQLKDRLFPWSQRRLEYLLEDIGEEAGLAKHLSFDMCRWSCALNDWLAQMDQDKIRQKLGVSKVQWRELAMKLERLAGRAA